jgi:tetratricopeptide (TPR) repeat protein
MSCWCNGSCRISETARTLIDAGRQRDAETELRARLIDAPHCPVINGLMAHLLIDGNRAYLAPPFIEEASAGDQLEWLMLRGSMARRRGMIPDAISNYADAYDQARKLPAAFGLITALEASGTPADLDRAMDVAMEIARRFPEDVRVIRHKAIVHAARGDFGEAAEILNGLTLFPMARFERGRYRDRLGDHDGAWEDWSIAKRDLREKHQHRFNRETFDTLIADSWELAARPLRVPQGFAPGWPYPLFITGSPRSGTTMLETVFSSHPDIAAGDEMQTVYMLQPIAEQLLGYRYPLCLANMDEPSARTLQMYYLAHAREKIDNFDAAAFFTDKMPLNEIHLPLLLSMFGYGLGVVRHIRRHPLDIVVSSWSYYITHGYYQCSALDALAYAYTRGDDLLERYKETILQREDFKELRYEDFVAAPDATIKEIMPIGMEPVPEMRDFHKNPRTSRTISHAQVKQPLYDRSVGRYVPYLKHLGPVIDALRPVIKRGGYEI